MALPEAIIEQFQEGKKVGSVVLNTHPSYEEGNERLIAVAHIQRKNPTISGLHVGQVAIDHETATAFSEILHNNPLIKLTVAHARLGTDGMRAVIKLMERNTFSNLAFMYVEIDPADRKRFAEALQVNHSLTEVNFTLAREVGKALPNLDFIADAVIKSGNKNIIWAAVSAGGATVVSIEKEKELGAFYEKNRQTATQLLDAILADQQKLDKSVMKEIKERFPAILGLAETQHTEEEIAGPFTALKTLCASQGIEIKLPDELQKASPALNTAVARAKKSRKISPPSI